MFELKEGKNAQNSIQKLLTLIYHYLVVEKRNNLNRFCFEEQRIKPKTHFSFIYLLFFAGLFV